MSFDVNKYGSGLPEEVKKRVTNHMNSLERALTKAGYNEAQKEAFRAAVGEYETYAFATNYYKKKMDAAKAEALKFKELYEQPGISDQKAQEYLAKFNKYYGELKHYQDENYHYAKLAENAQGRKKAEMDELDKTLRIVLDQEKEATTKKSFGGGMLGGK